MQKRSHLSQQLHYTGSNTLLRCVLTVYYAKKTIIFITRCFFKRGYRVYYLNVISIVKESIKKSSTALYKCSIFLED